MAEKKGDNPQSTLIIKIILISLALIAVVGVSYFYLIKNKNKKIEVNTQENNVSQTKNDQVRMDAFQAYKKNPSLKLNDPLITTIDNAKILSVSAPESKIVVLGQDGKEVQLKVTGASKIQKMTILSANKKLWQDITISEVPNNVNATVAYNKNNEVVFLAFTASK